MGITMRRYDLDAYFGKDDIRFLTERLAEVSLLLPVPQTEKLEKLAYTMRLTLGQLLRLLIREYLAALEEMGDESDKADGA